MTVQEYLNKKGFDYQIKNRPSGRTAVMNCPFCNTNEKSFAISIETGAYNCMRKNNCGVSGSWYNFMKHFGDDFKSLHDNFYFSNPKQYKKPMVHSEKISDSMIEYFKSRKISHDAIKYFKIGRKDNSIMFPFFKNKELLNVKYRKIGTKEFYREQGCMPILFNQDNIETDYLIIVEGEVDSMSLYEYGLFSTSIPSGVNDMGWIENDWNFLERFNSIYIIMDNDIAGQSVVEKMVERLGRWRCKNVLLPFKDINECLMNSVSKDDIHKIIFDDCQDFGMDEIKSPIQFESELIDYVSNPNKSNGNVCGSSELTNILKGWRKQELTVWTGRNGSGKSTFVNQEIEHIIESGLRACIGSFELPPKIYLLWLLKQHYKKDNLTSNEISEGLKYYSGKLFIFDIVGNVKKENLFNLMEFASRKYGIDHYVIDSLMKINLDVSELKILGEQKNLVSELSDFTKKFDCHIHLIAHPRKGKDDSDIPGKSDVAGNSNITDLADNVIIIHRYTEKQLEEMFKKTAKQYSARLAVEKNRAHGFIGHFNLNFSPEIKCFKTDSQLNDDIAVLGINKIKSYDNRYGE